MAGKAYETPKLLKAIRRKEPLDPDIAFVVYREHVLNGGLTKFDPKLPKDERSFTQMWETDRQLLGDQIEVAFRQYERQAAASSLASMAKEELKKPLETLRDLWRQGPEYQKELRKYDLAGLVAYLDKVSHV